MFMKTVRFQFYVVLFGCVCECVRNERVFKFTAEMRIQYILLTNLISFSARQTVRSRSAASAT